MTYPRDGHAEFLDTPEKQQRYLDEYRRTARDMVERARQVVLAARRQHGS